MHSCIHACDARAFGTSAKLTKNHNFEAGPKLKFTEMLQLSSICMGKAAQAGEAYNHGFYKPCK